jgi:hypothetical protein
MDFSEIYNEAVIRAGSHKKTHGTFAKTLQFRSSIKDK